MPRGWERLATWEGGTVAGLATVTAEDGSTLVFAATPLGIHRSADGGRSWGLPGAAGAVPLAEVVVASPRFAHDRALFAGAQAGLYRSGDGGESWRLVLTGSRVLSLVCPPAERPEPMLLAGTEDDGVLVSRDAGRGWKGANAGLLDLTVLALAVSPDFERDGLAWAATPSGLYRSRNGAESWRMVELEPDDVVVQCLAVSPAFADDRLVLAGTEAHGLLRSDDAGRSWSAVPDLAEGGVTGLAFSARGLVAAATDPGLALSSDGGRSWRLVGAELGPVLSLGLVPDGPGEALLAGLPDRGVARSADDGLSWAPANAGLNASLLVGLSLSPAFGRDRTIFAVGLRSGVSVSADGGRTWAERNAGLEEGCVFQVAVSPAFARDQRLWAATGAGLYHSRDGAATWQPALPEGPASPARAVLAGPAGPEGAVLVLAALADGQLLSSDDGGATWRPLGAPWRPAEIVALGLSPVYVSDETIFAATTSPAAPAATGELVVWRSTDRGGTWERWLEAPGSAPLPLVVPPSYPLSGELFVGLGGRILRPRRGAREVRGGSRRPLWRALELPGRPSALTALVASPSYLDDRALFAATGAGVYLSRDGGERFRPWSEGLAPPSVVALAPSPAYARDRLVYALGLGGTIWRRRDRL